MDSDNMNLWPSEYGGVCGWKEAQQLFIIVRPSYVVVIHVEYGRCQSKSKPTQT